MHQLRAWLHDRRATARELRTLLGLAPNMTMTGSITLHLTIGVLPIVFSVALAVALDALAVGVPATFWLATGAGAFVAHQLLAPWQQVVSQAIGRQVDAACSARLMRVALNELPLAAVESTPVSEDLGEVCRRLDESWSGPGAAAAGALGLIARYTQLAGAVIVLAVAAGPLAAGFGLTVALMMRLGQTTALRQFGAEYNDLSAPRRRMTYLTEMGTDPRAAKEIRTLGMVPWLDQRYQAETHAYLTPMWAMRRRVYGRPFVIYTVLGLIGAGGLLVQTAAVSQTSAGMFTAGLQTAVLCISFGVQLFPESDFALLYGLSGWEALRRVERRLTPSAPTAKVQALPSGGPDVRCTDVYFAYPDGPPVIKGLDLVLAAGTSTAVVGMNGSGKTTLVKLLTGLYQPDAGRIRIGDIDLPSVDTQQWQRRVAVVFQDYVHYELSLRDNITLPQPEHRIDDAGIHEVLGAAGLDSLLNDGVTLETPLSRSLPGGRDLSGGQWQRVALARALFAVRHGATLLVLDEPTAQFDARGEADFYTRFLELTRGVTSLIISHRFSSVRRADHIVVLSNGAVIEAGSHAELLAANGTYSELFTVQATRFTDPSSMPEKR
jgi:ATP-binding cassette subfamily B protein